MIRLDFLQNPPLHSIANALLYNDLEYNNASPADSSWYKMEDLHAKKLAEFFGVKQVEFFDGSVGSYFELLISLHLQNYKLAIASSLHYNAIRAANLLREMGIAFEWLTPEMTSGTVTKALLLNAKSRGCNAFIIPYVNEDLLTLNPWESYARDAGEIWIGDISYQVATGMIPKALGVGVHWLLSGEALGLARGHGAILGDALPSFFPKPLQKAHAYQALYLTAEERLSLKSTQDQKESLYEILHSLLGGNISLFSPLYSTLPNALSLRFSNIRARALMQALLTDKIYVINGQQCLFGFSKPSHVLQNMGYEEDEARELLSVSFLPMDQATLRKLAETIALRYKQINLYL